MSPEWTLIVVLLAVVWLLRVCAVRAELLAVQADRIAVLERELEREKAKTANRFKPRALPAWVTEPADTPALVPAGPVAALPAGNPEFGAFAGTPVIDLAYDAADTVELPVVKLTSEKPDPQRRMVNPMRPDHDAYRPHWPGTKENAHAR